MFVVKTSKLVRLSLSFQWLMVSLLPPVILLYVVFLNLFMIPSGYFLLDDRKLLKLLNLAGPLKIVDFKPLVMNLVVCLDLPVF